MNITKNQLRDMVSLAIKNQISENKKNESSTRINSLNLKKMIREIMEEELESSKSELEEDDTCEKCGESKNESMHECGSEYTRTTVMESEARMVNFKEFQSIIQSIIIEENLKIKNEIFGFGKRKSKPQDASIDIKSTAEDILNQVRNTRSIGKNWSSEIGSAIRSYTEDLKIREELGMEIKNLMTDREKEELYASMY